MRFLSFLFVFVLFFLSVSNVYSEDKVSKQDEVVVEKSVVSEEKNETTFKFISCSHFDIHAPLFHGRTTTKLKKGYKFQ